jgi:hypothetical protein
MRGAGKCGFWLVKKNPAPADPRRAAMTAIWIEKVNPRIGRSPTSYSQQRGQDLQDFAESKPIQFILLIPSKKVFNRGLHRSRQIFHHKWTRRDREKNQSGNRDKERRICPPNTRMMRKKEVDRRLPRFGGLIRRAGL